MKKLYLFFLIFNISFVSHINIFSQNDSPNQECFMILAGKDATVDGSTLVAHNNDLKGTEASFFLKIPRQIDTLYLDDRFGPDGNKFKVDETYEQIALRTIFGFGEGDAISINEFQVAIAGGVSLKDDRNEKAADAVPLIKNGVGGVVRFIAVERSKTARECVEIIGAIYSRLGIAYNSGVAVSDPNEVWYIEAGGGYAWAAVKIPDDKFMAVANGYRIGVIDPDDSVNVITSPNLIGLAKEKGLWKPDDGPFNFAHAFGGGREERKYNTRRVWRGISLLNSSLNLSPDQLIFPMFVEPDEKISVEKLISILRDEYQDTEYFVNPVNGNKIDERAICVPRAVHTEIVQLRNWLPAEIGAVLWAGLNAPTATPFMPFYFGVNKIDESFAYATKSFNTKSSFWIFRALTNRLYSDYRNTINEVLPRWQNFESEIFVKQKNIEIHAGELYKRDVSESKNYLTGYTGGLCAKALQKAKWLLMYLK